MWRASRSRSATTEETWAKDGGVYGIGFGAGTRQTVQLRKLILGPERLQKIVTELLRETPTSLIVQLIQDEWHWC